jgi:hypothetical protein
MIGGPAAGADAAGTIALLCCICASACSEYGSFNALGSLLYAAVLPRPDGAAPVNGSVRVSLPTGAIGGTAGSGVVTAPGAAVAAPASPGGARVTSVEASSWARASASA